MELIYIGVQFVRVVRMQDGSAFESAPDVILYDPVSKKYYTATVEASEGEENAYVATFPAELTALMMPGTYTLEVYSDNEHTDLLKRIEKFAKAVVVANTPGQTPVEPEEEV